MWWMITSMLKRGRTGSPRGLGAGDKTHVLEQKISEARAAGAALRRRLAALVAKSAMEKNALAHLDFRILELEGRALAAMASGDDAIAVDAARLIAALESERAARRASLASTAEKSERRRRGIAHIDARLAELEQGLRAERRRSLAGGRAQRDAELVSWLLAGRDPVIDNVGAFEDEEPSDAGDVQGRKVSAQDVLARLRSRGGAPPSCNGAP